MEAKCAICGGAHSTMNCDYVNITNHIFNRTTSPRARLSLPKDFSLHTLASGGYKVVTNKFIQKGTRFGPLEAVKTITLNPNISFPLKIFSLGEDEFLDYYLDTTNEETSTWMIFIEPAESCEEQNLICYQEDQYIYYLSIKDISENDSLKVWYAPEYARKMSIKLLTEESDKKISPDIKALNDIVKLKPNIPQVESWSCKFCSQNILEVTTFADHLIEHYKKQNKKKCRRCNSVQCLCQHMVKKSFNVEKLANNKIVEISVVQNTSREMLIGDPLLNSLAPHENIDTSDFIMPSLCQLSEDSQILGVENFNTENLLLAENFRALDYFNFEIEETKEDEIICDICSKRFTSLANLIQHLKGHRGDYHCSSCSKVFARKENLIHHSCNATITHHCPTCNKTFSQQKYYKRHIDTVHNKKFECDHCHKTYANSYELKQHNCEKQFNLRQLFVCDTCYKVFAQQRYLKKHMARVHNSTEIFICEICSKGYGTKKAYEMHALTHEDSKFKCEICQKEFRRRDTLKEHVLNIHMNQEEKCDICDKTFKNKKYLMHHRKIHDNVKYNCSICNSSFDTKSNLTRHSKKHQEDKDISNDDSQYQCQHCGKKMKLRSSLARHIQSKHTSSQEDVEGEAEGKAVLQFLGGGLDLITDSQDNIDLIDDEDIDELGRNNIQVIDNILLTKSEEMGLGVHNYILNSNDTKSVSLMKPKENEECGKKNMNREVVLSMPDLMEIENDIILGNDEFMVNSGIMDTLGQENL